MPWVGAAIGIASLFGADLFADGGAVGGRQPDAPSEADVMAARKNIYETLFKEKYTGAPEQDARIQSLVAEATAQAGVPPQGDVARAQVDQSAAPRQDYTRGGRVAGLGGPTDDTVPAWLANGEYVVDAETGRQVGRPKLDQMNNQGLRARGQGK